jgi:hypothetical protein
MNFEDLGSSNLEDLTEEDLKKFELRRVTGPDGIVIYEDVNRSPDTGKIHKNMTYTETKRDLSPEQIAAMEGIKKILDENYKKEKSE